MNCRETPPVKGNLLFPALVIVGDSRKRGFNKVTNRRGRGGAISRRLLVAEETALTATYRGKKNGYDQWIRAYINLPFEIADFGFQISGISICNL
jgi:hypothetical protein